MHAGFVGRGMLDAACCGEIFTSPAPGHILTGTRAVHADAGVLYVVKNYTGDVMNFGLAAESARRLGIEVESVIVADDVALPGEGHGVGRRGTGVTMLVQKIAGAKAERGATLAEVAEVARKVESRGRSFGVALTSCVNPVSGRPTIELGEDEIEVGVGIHGEPGLWRAPIRTASEIVEGMTEAILDDLQPLDGADLLVFVNGFGATPLLELYLVYGEVDKRVRARGLQPARRLVGDYVTSLDAAGVSITLLVLDDELIMLWDDAVLTPGLRWRA
jgi:dihydroxyacetone kinase-like protein